MELQLTGTNVEIIPPVKRYAERKLGKLDRHLPTITETKVEISEEKTKSRQQRFLVRVTVNSGTGGTVFHGEQRGEDSFEAIDKVSDIMVRQLERHKGKLYDKGRGSSLSRSQSSLEQAEPARQIVRVKRFTIEPMPVAEAIEKMEALSHSFFLFRDEEDGGVKLIYRRRDDNYGLIETNL
jgi:putative sigma-54 modulation protein